MKLLMSISIFALAASLVSCGGGGNSSDRNSSNSNSSTSTQLTSSTVTQGTITGFGSVIVNGVHYDVGSANISVDDANKVESDLNVGETVRISAEAIANGKAKATKLAGEAKVRGQITSIDTANSLLVALGQTILVTADTQFRDGITFASFKLGDVIRVSGYTNASNQLVATRIDILTGNEAKDLMLSGTVADLNKVALTFSLNGTTVDYSKATLNDLPTKSLSNGLGVRVHGNYTNGIFVAVGNVHLSSLDLKHDGEVDLHADLGAGGLVKDLVPGVSFMLENTKVLLQSTTTYENGTVEQLSNGLLVKVRGTFDTDKNLVASKVTLMFKPKVDEEGLIQTIDLTNKKLSLNGVTYEITVDTLFYDRGLAKVRLFDIEDLAVGDYIQVRGYKIPATATTAERLIATSVVRKNSNERSSEGFKVEIKGLITASTSNSITINGRTIVVNSFTEIRNITTIQSFLSGAVGLSVEVKAIFDGTSLIAKVIELEDDEDQQTSNSSNSKSSSSKSSLSSTSKSSSSTAVSSSSLSSAASSVAGDAVNGKTLYESNTLACVSCHGATGNGATNISKSKTLYGGKTLANYITTQMPVGDIGACNTQCGLDIAAYIKTW